MQPETENQITQEQITQFPGVDVECDLKRPPNAFIIFYRNVKSELLKTKGDIAENEIDRMAGKMWNMTDEQTKNQFREQAKQLAEVFKTMHPDFIESPRKRRTTIPQSKIPEPIKIRVILHPEQQHQQNSEDPLGALTAPPKTILPESVGVDINSLSMRIGNT